MMDETGNTMWCPNCGAEYRTGFTECADCGVPLTATRPPLDDEGVPVTSVDHARRTAHDDHDVVAYDLAGLTDDQLAALALLLDGAEIDHTQEGDDNTLLLVPHVRQAEVEAMIDSIEGVDLDDDTTVEERAEP